ncbi:hypothetical protein BJF90_09220 [Pseudonocardia sp. CNS-004]|nr:hypothetical protein BJF90_09220 [Pseudonocardia sp. CNS-004]
MNLLHAGVLSFPLAGKAQRAPENPSWPGAISRRAGAIPPARVARIVAAVIVLTGLLLVGIAPPAWASAAADPAAWAPALNAIADVAAQFWAGLGGIGVDWTRMLVGGIAGVSAAVVVVVAIADWVSPRCTKRCGSRVS